MDARQPGAPGHYGALGVAPTATPRQVEQAYRRWGERLASGEEDLDAYRRAESAYHVLAVPDSRVRHDRQLGLLEHPAWRSQQDRLSQAWVRAALQELERGGVARALELLRRATSRVPNDPQARSYLALALVRAGGSLHEAAAHGRYATERQPEEPAFHFNLAEVYAAAGLRSRALGARARGWQAVLAALLTSDRRM